MDIYVHRPLIAALPRVENAFHPSWRALAGMRASQPGRACVAAGLYDKGDPSTPGASRPALRMTRAPRFAPCAQDDEGAAPARRLRLAARCPPHFAFRFMRLSFPEAVSQKKHAL